MRKQPVRGEGLEASVPERHAGSLLVLLIAWCCGIAVVGLAVGVVSATLLGSAADHFAPDGRMDTLTPARIARLRMVCVAGGVLHVLCAAALLAVRRQATRWLVEAGSLFREWRAQARADARAYLRGIPRNSALVLALLSLLGLALRVAMLFEPMRNDEVDTFLNYASHSFVVLLSSYPEPNNHVLHSMFTRAAYLLFGNEPWALRLPALVPGLLLIPATYALGRRTGNS